MEEQKGRKRRRDGKIETQGRKVRRTGIGAREKETCDSKEEEEEERSEGTDGRANGGMEEGG